MEKTRNYCQTSKTATTIVPQTISRVPNGDDGHYAAWVEACIAGYGSDAANNLSSRFDVAGPLTESVLMGNLAIRSYNIRKPKTDGGFDYPGQHIQLIWDGENMKITNFDEANQFVKTHIPGRLEFRCIVIIKIMFKESIAFLQS